MEWPSRQGIQFPIGRSWNCTLALLGLARTDGLVLQLQASPGSTGQSCKRRKRKKVCDVYTASGVSSKRGVQLGYALTKVFPYQAYNIVTASNTRTMTFLNKALQLSSKSSLMCLQDSHTASNIITGKIEAMELSLEARNKSLCLFICVAPAKQEYTNLA